MKKAIICSAYIFVILTSYAQSSTPNKPEDIANGFITGQFEISDYNTACYFALAGNKKLAITYLKNAVANGFNQSKTLNTDSDLSSLHDEKEWDAIVKKVRENEDGKTNEHRLFFNQPSFWESRFFTTPFRENISEDEKVAGLSKFWAEIKYNFINLDLAPEINIDSLYFEYLPKVKQTNSTIEYYKVLTEMCATLKDGHTNVYAPAELRNELYARPLLRTRLIEDKVMIVDVDHSLQEKGIKPGLELINVNNMPVKEYAAKYITPYESASTPQDLIVRSYDYALLAGSVKQPLILTFRDSRGKIFDNTISRVSPSERYEKLKYPAVVYKMLPGNIAYLAINSFATDSGSKVFTEKYPEISNSNAFIIDLRNNGGGSTDWTILRHFIDQPVTIHKMYTRQYNGTFRAWQRQQNTSGSTDGITPIKEGIYSKQVIVLISARTFSAAEDFAAAFKSLKRGMVIGEPSGGSTGQPLGISLPGGLTARICTKRDQYADGSDFVGKGVIPDKIVECTITDLRKGIDTQLEAAIKEIQKR